ncbi:lamin tail domain-containing protein 2 [Rhinophrynus dorsalis]
MSGYILWQLEGNYPVSMYRFPLNTLLPGLHHITIWTSAAKVSHNPPTDFVWNGRVYFRSNPQCITVLSRPSGQPVASYSVPKSLVPAKTDNPCSSINQKAITCPLEEGHRPIIKSTETAHLSHQIMGHTTLSSVFVSTECNQTGTVTADLHCWSQKEVDLISYMNCIHSESPTTFITCYPSRLNINSPIVRLMAQTSARSKHGFKFLSYVPFTRDLLRS